jgi:hypothetical protein
MNTINDIVLRGTVAGQTAVQHGARRVSNALARRSRDDERGEGVISVALAVLIMAGIAALMWVAYKVMWDDASKRTADEVKKIGA